MNQKDTKTNTVSSYLSTKTPTNTKTVLNAAFEPTSPETLVELLNGRIHCAQ